jgi:hypothetical protein
MRRKNFLFPLSVTLLIGVALSGVCVLTADAISDSHEADAKAEKAAGGKCPARAEAGEMCAMCAANANAHEEGACPRCAAMKGKGHRHGHAMHARLDKALKALDAAEKAVEAGEKETALAEIAKARMLLTPPPAEKPKPEQAGVVNTHCPIMGTKLDPEKVPANLTREFEGKKVGFCCGGCPAAWDALSEQEKQAKLNAASES